MGLVSFNLANNVTINNSAVTGNGKYTIWTSTNVSAVGNQSMRVIIDYKTSAPDETNVTAIVESEQNGHWFPIAYQFNPFNNLDNGPQRIIIMQPDISVFNTGIDDDMYVGGQVIARISRFQGKVGSNLRVKLVLQESNYGTPNAFQSLNIDCYGECY